MAAPLLHIEDLSISFPGDDGGARSRVVDRVSFAVARGETLGIVGESGSGKTMIGRAILNLLPPGGRIDSGRVMLDGTDLAGLPAPALRAVRGRRLGMIFQEPMTSLNPSLTIGRQMTEGVMLHFGVGRAEADRRAEAMLEKVRIGDPRAALAAYPHVFSGGMRQRIMLASVLMLEPDLLIADEPTTALDAVIQKQVLDLMMALVGGLGTALILISHDLPLVAKYTRRAIVMRRGGVVESGAVAEIMARPQQAYTRALLEALPLRGPDRPVDRAARPVVEASGVSVVFAGKRTWPWSPRRQVVAVDDVSLSVQPGEIVGLVGESGSGKTTLGRAILDLVPLAAGSVRFDGRERRPGERRFRKDMQIVFQDPYSSLDPRMTVHQIVAEGLRHSRSLSADAKRARVADTLDAAQIPLAAYGERYPHELSGGQRQRVCIARAVVTRPRFVVADEPVSALDLTVQKEILTLLKRLQDQLGFSALFISHDIGVVEEIADRIVVMYRGRIVEAGMKTSFFARPTHPYTRHLLSAVPELVKDEAGIRTVRDRFAPPVDAPAGFAFATPQTARRDVVYHPVRPEHHVALVAGTGHREPL